MQHPIMFRDDDPVLAKVQHDRARPVRGAEDFEKVSHGRPAFFVTKMFVIYDGTMDLVLFALVDGV